MCQSETESPESHNPELFIRVPQTGSQGRVSQNCSQVFKITFRFLLCNCDFQYLLLKSNIKRSESYHSPHKRQCPNTIKTSKKEFMSEWSIYLLFTFVIVVDDIHIIASKKTQLWFLKLELFWSLATSQLDLVSEFCTQSHSDNSQRQTINFKI